MKKRIIEISVNDEYVVGSGVVIGSEGDDESVALRISFNDMWMGLNIYATFKDSYGENPAVKLLLPSMLVPGDVRTYDVVVPAAATKHRGKMSLVLSGFSVTSDKIFNTETKNYDNIVYRDAVINTTNAYFRVLPSDFSALDVEDQAEVTALEQVLAEINELHGDIAEHEEAVDNRITEAEVVVAQIREEANSGAFKGEKGDPYDLTDEDKAKIADMVEVEIIGDINEALDRILAVQKDLIDEPITFNLHGIKCIALEGMTWGEWIESVYNTVEVYLVDVDKEYFQVYMDGGSVYEVDEMTSQYENDVIVANEDYFHF